MSAIPDIALEDGTVWDAAEDNAQNKPVRRLRSCPSCLSILASPQNLNSLINDEEFELCSTSARTNGCALRAIALAAFQESPECKGLVDVVFCLRSLQNYTPLDGGGLGVVELFAKGRRDGQDEYPRSYDLVQFDICADHEDPASRFIRARPTIVDMVAKETFALMNSWLHECLRDHTDCASSGVTPLPTRVIDVDQSSGSEVVRLVETKGRTGQYVALSYCWGGPQPVTLTTKTREQMLDTIPLGSLPESLQDAILVTRGLDLRFIWIDALCIVQDGDYGQDKKQELRSMDAYYKNAHVTISAASATSCVQGFLQPRQRPASRYPRFALPYRAWADASTMGTVILEERRPREPASEPINQRCWTMQEKLLSPRLLIFGRDKLQWRCRRLDRTAGVSAPASWSEARLDRAFFDTAAPLPTKAFRKYWSRVVEDYSRRSLSFPGDKLVALSAVASEFRRLCPSSGDDDDCYLAGLWRHDLLWGLAWGTFRTAQWDALPRPTQYVAPSWSWASISGPFQCWTRLGDPGPAHAEVLRCETSPEDKHGLPTGAVVAGALEIRASTRDATCLWRAGTQHKRGEVFVETTTTTTTSADPSAPGQRLLAYVYSDACDERPDTAVVTCLRLFRSCGLVLRPAVGGGGDGDDDSRSPRYRRIGFVDFDAGLFARGQEAREDYRRAVVDAWWEGCETRTVVIV